MTDRLPTVCPDCGRVYERDDTTAACPDCKPVRTARPNHYARGSATARGYGYAWRKLSERARRLSPQCEDCGATTDLTADHSAEAWLRHERGQVVRLRDVAVVCRRCNAERGAARGARGHEHARWERPDLAQLAQELEDDDDRLERHEDQDDDE